MVFSEIVAFSSSDTVHFLNLVVSDPESCFFGAFIIKFQCVLATVVAVCPLGLFPLSLFDI